MQAPTSLLDPKKTSQYVSDTWDNEIVPQLCEFIKIPNQSPFFDKDWATNGLTDRAVKLLVDWINTQNVQGLTMEVVKLEGRTPLIFAEIPASPGCANKDNTVLLYGHLDKQPPLTESWDEGLGPYTPVIRDGRLYGRGGADDGYAAFAAITAIKGLDLQGVPHARCVLIIEASEESGSPDLPHYIIHLKDRIKTPSLIVCLDSGCGDYEHFWMTSSLRGLIAGDLKVQITTEGTHSGMNSGVVPSSFRIIRKLLDRIEDVDTGKILLDEFFTNIPEARIKQAEETAGILGNSIVSETPFVLGARPVSDNPAELLINRTWKPTLSITGADGLPSLESAGNVLRTHTTLKLSIRIPPHINTEKASEKLKQVLEADPPYGAKVTCVVERAAAGWESPALPEWLEESVRKAAVTFFGASHKYNGEGGSIPFMGMLGELYPEANFIVTGLLGPKSNAHGPNEFLHIQMGKNVTSTVTAILADHAAH